ncbi:hypothetical protein FLONG3_3045 [Fusarium longipes]|uniref:Zn(2)-C6 fungal-type domain-containing protein n=1 Tax=Fusarium longipes TaxID=694270 RepID=A0A395T2Z4_9HYPO|nr:hypothetical protein FLONG3_3045 [Fusarium longipes]
MIASVDQEQSIKPRARKSHVRSRTGCTACRNKRVRCDEQRPICDNCATTGQACEFAAPLLPLRERRKEYLPGEQQPWAVVGKPSPAVPPRAFSYCASHIDLPLKSIELFHYFHKVGRDDEIVPQDKRQKLLASSMHQPDALRNTLLIAGFHYIVNAGQNNTLSEQIASTIGAENIRHCYLGNHDAAETHLNGLMKFMNFYCPIGMSAPPDLTLTAELATRYIILIDSTYSFISACKSRVMIIPKDAGKAAAPEVVAAMHGRYNLEGGGLTLKLRSMEILPYFFAPLSSTKEFRDIDALPMIDCLLVMTEVSQSSESATGKHPIQQLLWLEGAATVLVLSSIESHIETMHGQHQKVHRGKAPRGMRSSWSGILIATELYLHQVLGLWQLEAQLELTFHSHILTYLIWDLSKSSKCLEETSTAASNLWFWKAFVGAFSTARHIDVHGQLELYPLQSRFYELLCKWSRVSGIEEWEEAREVLLDTVWPNAAFAHEALAETVWYESQVQKQG